LLTPRCKPWLPDPNQPASGKPGAVQRLLDATVCLKQLATLSLAYGVHLRVAEVAALRISDIDSTRMLLRIERGTRASGMTTGPFKP
jgi:integrase